MHYDRVGGNNFKIHSFNFSIHKQCETGLVLVLFTMICMCLVFPMVIS
jgi:hypothetical protein